MHYHVWKSPATATHATLYRQGPIWSKSTAYYESKQWREQTGGEAVVRVCRDRHCHDWRREQNLD